MDAVLPVKNHSNDTGMDVTSVEDIVIPARDSAVVDVGLKFAFIEEGYWVKVEGRSGLGFKHGLMPHPGIIDEGYRGDAGVKLYNFTDSDYQVCKGDRVAQFVVYKNHDVVVGEEAGKWTVKSTGSKKKSTGSKNKSTGKKKPARGSKGFGSSGK